MEANTLKLPQVLEIIEEIRSSLWDQYGQKFRGIVLYGSYARGDYDSDSDIDLLVLLSDEHDLDHEKRKVSQLARELCHRTRLHGVLLSPMVVREDSYQKGKTPFYLNVKREGISFAPGGSIDMQSETDDLMRRARRDLEAVRLLMEREFYDLAAARCYYAMFYAAEAALLSRGIARSRHQGVIAAFNEQFVNTGLMPGILPAMLPSAFEQRNEADYGSEPVPEERARGLLQDAERFVEAVEGLLGRQSE